MTHRKRLIAGPVGIVIVVVFAVAVWVTPDPRGFGTHQQLGMPPCAFRALVGINCPHCGLTTSFSWFVRGRFQKSIEPNPSRFILPIASVLVLIWSVVVSIRGSFVIIHEPGRFFLLGFAGWVLVSILIWLFKLFSDQK